MAIIFAQIRGIFLKTKIAFRRGNAGLTAIKIKCNLLESEQIILFRFMYFAFLIASISISLIAYLHELCRVSSSANLLIRPFQVNISNHNVSLYQKTRFNLSGYLGVIRIRDSDIKYR